MVVPGTVPICVTKEIVFDSNGCYVDISTETIEKIIYYLILFYHF